VTRTHTQIPEWVSTDPHWGPTIFLLNHLSEQSGLDHMAHVDFERRTIDWSAIGLRSNMFSHSEELMIDLAANLWNGTKMVSPYDWCSRLDNGNFPVVLKALAMARGYDITVTKRP